VSTTDFANMIGDVPDRVERSLSPLQVNVIVSAFRKHHAASGISELHSLVPRSLLSNDMLDVLLACFRLDGQGDKLIPT